MARTVMDAALMMNVLAQPDARDWHALPWDKRNYLQGLEEGVTGLRIAYSANLGYAKVDREIAVLVKQAAKAFEDLGAKVEEADPGFEDQQDVFTLHWFPGAAYVVRGIPAAKRKLMDKGLLEVARAGEKITMAQYQDAVAKRGALGILMNRFHQKYDLLLTPTLPLAAFDAGKEVADVVKERRWTDWTPFSYPFNLTQQPAASIPCGLTKAGLPAGLHIVGPKYGDALVLRAARAYEKAKPIALPDLSGLKR
jgi:aspartyl-tRNA(Asn)/glutamyl-tRNA(Gln) amidotransferase subunit A